MFFFAVPKPFFAQENTLNGAELCTAFISFLEKNDLNPVRLPLTDTAVTDYPFNMRLDFLATESPDTLQEDARNDLYIVFRIEECAKVPSFVLQIIRAIQNTSRTANIRLLFSYGDKIAFYGQTKLCGTNAFIDSAENTDGISAVCVSLEAKRNAVIPGSSGDCSPAWLVRLVSGALSENGIYFSWQGGFLSSFYRLNIMQMERRTGLFLENNIPAIGVDLALQNQDSDGEKRAAAFFGSIATNFNAEESTVWDRHSKIIQIGSLTITVTEQFTIIAFILFTMTSLFVLCELSFIIRASGAEISQKVLEKWYLIPLLIATTTVAFFVGQGFSFVLSKIFSADYFLQTAVKIIIGFIIISVAYLMNLRFHTAYSAQVYSYLLTVASLINIFIFSLIDISLFYLFALEYLFIYASRPIKRTGTLAVLFVVLALPFLPVGYQIIKYGTARLFRAIIYSPIALNIAFSCAFLPFEFVWFRILARLNSRWKQTSQKERTFIKQNLIVVISAVLVFALILGLLVLKIPDTYKRSFTRLDQEIIDADESRILLSVTDEALFFDTERILKVTLFAQTENLSVTVKGTDSAPILYSSEPYFSDKQTNTDTFRLPAWPPKELLFRWIADTEQDTVILVRQAIPDFESHKMTIYQKELFIPAKKRAALTTENS